MASSLGIFSKSPADTSHSKSEKEDHISVVERAKKLSFNIGTIAKSDVYILHGRKGVSGP